MSVVIQGGFPFLDDGNATKFRGLFVPALKKVQRQVHSTLGHEDSALEFVETLLYQILASVCFVQPRSSSEVEDRVQKTFPHPIEGWAVKEAQRALENHTSKKKQELVFPADKLHSLLQKEVFGYKFDQQVSLYIAAVLEYMSADILKLSGNYVRNSRRNVVTTQDIQVAMSADKVLLDMFDADAAAPAEEDLFGAEKASLTYEELIKDLLLEESQYIRDLNMISHVFRKSFITAGCSDDLVQTIFGNLDEIYDFSLNLLNSLEDALEMCDEGDKKGKGDEGSEGGNNRNTSNGRRASSSGHGNGDVAGDGSGEGGGVEKEVKQVPPIGLCFEDLAMDGEFSVYETYAENYKCVPAKLEKMLIDHKLVAHFRDGPSLHFLEAMRYVLPKLLLGPIYHCFYYFDTLKVLWKATPDQADRDSFEEALSVLRELQSSLERVCQSFLPKKRDDTVRFQRRPVSRASVKKLAELQKSIDQWEGGDIATSCSELLLVGDLQRHLGKRKFTDRHVFLLDGLLLCCKLLPRKSSSSAGSEYRLKEKFNVRKMELIDLEDVDDLKFAFEVSDFQKKMTLVCKTQTEKSEWMNALVVLYVRSTLDRTLDAVLREEELAIPLPMPEPSVYKFATPDTSTNLKFEEGVQENYGVPVIRGGTLHKLVERLTYHKYADPAFVRTFLTTYRSFVEPSDLLTLLIERYNIPSPVEQANSSSVRSEVVFRESLKRFKREYVQPVQLRILNVLRQWVDNHFYDFERDPSLEVRLLEFVGAVKGKSMVKWVESIRRALERKHDSEAEAKLKSLTFETVPPLTEWHLTQNPEEFSIVTLHPVEIARQLTLIESKMFKAVKPSELVGGAWTKTEKAKNSPNLLKLIRFTTDITFWYEQCIVENESLEERAAVINRLVDIMNVLHELNNFDGVIAIVSAFNSSSIHRLEHTMKELKPHRRQFLEEMNQMTQDHYKKYKEKLRSINPPCVPFAGLYLTNLLHIEAGNKDWLTVEGAPEDTIINFSKRRKVAEVTGEIQQYQNQPYCLDEQPDISNFLLKVDPTKSRSDNEFEEYLFKKSKELESKGKPPLKASRRTKWDLKPPSIPRPYRHQSFTNVVSSVLGYSPSSPSGGMPVSLRKASTLMMADPGEVKSPKKSVSPPGGRSPGNFDRDLSPSLATPPASPSFHNVTDGKPLLPPRTMPKFASESTLSTSLPMSSFFDQFEANGENAVPPLPPRSPRLDPQSLQDPFAPKLPPRKRLEDTPPKLPPRVPMGGGDSGSKAPAIPPRPYRPS
eukprot:m.208247 g.208247  ORF g.208247 m.208247 type:complete len:1270 (+) comp39702_c0_seq23:557-4366(+)